MAIGGTVAGIYTLSPPLSSFIPTRLFSRSHFAAKLRCPPSIRLRASSTAVIDTETNPTVTLLLPPIEFPFDAHINFRQKLA